MDVNVEGNGHIMVALPVPVHTALTGALVVALAALWLHATYVNVKITFEINIMEMEVLPVYTPCQP